MDSRSLVPNGVPAGTRGTRAQHERSGASAVFGFVGVMLLIGILLIWRNLPASDALAWLPRIYLGANVLLVIRAVLSPRAGAISLMVTLFFLLFVALPVVVQFANNQFPFGGIYDDAQRLAALEIILVGQLSYYAGEALMAAIARRRPSPGIAEKKFGLNSRLALRAILLSLLVSVGVIAYVGPAQLMMPRFVLSGYTETAGGFIGQATLVGRSVSLFGVLVAIVLWRGDQEARRQPSVRLASALIFVSFVVLNFPPSLPRFQSLGAALAIACLIVPMFKTSWKALFALASPAFLFLLFPLIKLLGNAEGATVASSLRSNSTAYLLTADFDSYKQTMDAWLYTQTHELRGIESFQGAALFWVPRSMWEDKPVHSGELVASAHGYDFVNVASPLPAEGYLAFGLIGTVVAMSLFGAFVASTESKVRLASSFATSAPRVLVLYALVVGVVVIVLRGALVAVAPMLGSGFVAYALLARAQSRRSAQVTDETRPTVPRT